MALYPKPAAPAFLSLRDVFGFWRPVGHLHDRSEEPAIITPPEAADHVSV